MKQTLVRILNLSCSFDRDDECPRKDICRADHPCHERATTMVEHKGKRYPRCKDHQGMFDKQIRGKVIRIIKLSKG